MEFIAAVEALALVGLTVLSYRERQKLLDRIMARDWSEYRATATVAADPWAPSDATEAAIAHSWDSYDLATRQAEGDAGVTLERAG